MIEEHNHFNKF